MELTITLQGAFAAVVLASLLAFFDWLAVSVMGLKAGQSRLEDRIRTVAAELRGDIAGMETRLISVLIRRQSSEVEREKGDEDGEHRARLAAWKSSSSSRIKPLRSERP